MFMWYQHFKKKKKETSKNLVTKKRLNVLWDQWSRKQTKTKHHESSISYLLSRNFNLKHVWFHKLLS
jgi:hypothetical protein